MNKSFEKIWGMGSFIVWGARFLRWLRLEKVVSAVRTRATAGLFLRFHIEVLHSMRSLGIQMEEWKHNELQTTQEACRVCTSCGELMRDLLELKSNQLHCCLKVLHKSSNDEDIVTTWIRSEPLDGRSDKDDPEQPHFVHGNTVWSAFLGRYDGKFNWKQPFRCFSCNDLLEYKDLISNTRQDWSNFYRSTLVFPLRYARLIDGQRCFDIIGFLAFDSPRKKAFPELCDIFKYRDSAEQRAEYQDILDTTAPFHLGAVMADTLSTFLRPAYDKYATKGGENNGLQGEHS